MLKRMLDEGEGDFTDGAPWYIWILLIFIASVSFWQQALVTEERFVPALNVISKRYNIPDDIAGATLMAAGASSPEFFSSMVALFITHTSLGLGTVVGSEIFNQLCICSGSIFAAHNQYLKLDKAIAIREMGFYALGIVLLVIALDDRRPYTDENGNPAPKHIYVSFWKALLLFGGYVLYVVVLANFDAIMSYIDKKKEFKKGVSYGSLDVEKEKATYLRTLKFEHSENFIDTHRDLLETGATMSGFFERVESLEFGHSLRDLTNSASTLSKRALTFGMFETHYEKPSDQHDLKDIEEDEFEDKLSCFLWQRSQFYDKARAPKNAWHLRWFTFSNDAITSVPDRVDYADKEKKYRKFDQLTIDVSHNILKTGHTDGIGRKYTLMAPSKVILDKVVAKIEAILETWEEQEKDEATNGKTEDDPFDPKIEMEAEIHSPITEFPLDASALGILVHYVLYPLKMILQLTLPDVRHENSTISTAWWATISCLTWLIIGSYAMVKSLETLAELMNIPKLIVGVTASAVGTSLPNYVASQVAANQGFGNMAISNAFGSNTFNIMIALGLPWTLYIATVNNFDPYNELVDDGVTVSVAIMAGILVIHFVLMLMSDFQMYTWHAYLFIGLYSGYLAYCVAVVYL